MASKSNRRLRAVRKRHAELEARLRARCKGLAIEMRHDEAREVFKEIQRVTAFNAQPLRRRRTPEPFQPKRLKIVVGSERQPDRIDLSTLRPIVGIIEAPVLQSDGKVHGVNSQREDKRKPLVGGARGKR